MATQIVDTAVNPFCLIGPDGIVQWIGPGISELLDREPASLVGRSVLELVSADDGERISEALQMADQRLREGAPSTWEGGAPIVDVRRGDGSLLRVRLTVATSARTGLDGHVVQLRRAGGEGELHEALATMAAGGELLNVLTHLLNMAESELPWVRMGVAWDWRDRRFRQSLGGIPGVDPSDVLPGPATWSEVEPVPFRSTVDVLPAECAEPARAAGACDVWIQPLRVGSDPAVVVGWHLARWTITTFTEAALERAARLVGLALVWDQNNRALAWAASHDQLTGLDNRMSFLDALESRTDADAAVLYLDLDDFKPVNDRHGHAIGDEVLAAIAARLRAAIRPDDIVARLGGDEFAVLCRGADEAATDALAQRLVDEVRQPIVLAGEVISVGLSVGVASLDGSSPDEILHRADDALRRAKAEGKGGWRHSERAG